jgi:replication factor C small subunit
MSLETITTLPWVEKYRPKTLNDVVNQEEVITSLKNILKTKVVPHMLFAGPPGVGKTATAHAFAKDLYGPSYIEDGWFVEINASVTPDTPILIRDNGIIQRTTIGEFAERYFPSSTVEYVLIENGPEILSLDCKLQVVFKPVSAISRHRVGKVVRIRYEGGEVRTSLDHSVMIIDPSDGRLVEKKASDLRVGDYLVSFKTMLSNQYSEKPSIAIDLKTEQVIKQLINRIAYTQYSTTDQFPWLMDLYTAEGCLGFGGRGGRVISSLGLKNAQPIINKQVSLSKDTSGIDPYIQIDSSGFNRSRKSLINVVICGTPLARYFGDIFYTGSKRRAATKHIPEDIFNMSPSARIEFMKRYIGDASGRWGGVLRYTLRSQEALIDLVWLASITNIEGSVFQNECRVIWKSNRFSYVKSDLLPLSVILNLIGKNHGGNIRRPLRHQLYGKKNSRISKSVLLKTLRKIDMDGLTAKEREIYNRLLDLVRSPLYVLKITSVEIEDYGGYVYDVSVPGSEVFWGGTKPVLLHNSDERGIQTIRDKVKMFARQIPMGGEVGFKILLLDESDQLTDDAQHAFRRVMEQYSGTCRFILAANYSNRIIEPIQSRCAVFRFRPLLKKDIIGRIKWIAEQEKLEVDDAALETIYEFSEGDMRRAINTLQAAASISRKIDEKTVYYILGYVSRGEIRKILELAMSGNFVQARDELRKLIYVQGLAGSDIVSAIYRELFYLDLSEEDRLGLIDLLGEVDYRIAEGGTEEVQLVAFLARLAAKSRKVSVGR